MSNRGTLALKLSVAKVSARFFNYVRKRKNSDKNPQPDYRRKRTIVINVV